MGSLRRIPNFPDDFVHILCAMHTKGNVASISHACGISKLVYVILKSPFDLVAHSDNRKVNANAIREIQAMRINILNEGPDTRVPQNHGLEVENSRARQIRRERIYADS
jgi:hypothetical protein